MSRSPLGTTAAGLVLALLGTLGSAAVVRADEPTPEPVAGEGQDAVSDARADMEQHRAALDPLVRDALGAPVAEPVAVPTGYRWDHAGGALLWSSTPLPSGEHPVAAVLAPILARYDGLGGPSGALGFPAGDTEPILGEALRQRFARAHIYWSAATGAREVRGAILGRYLATGGATGVLGLPTTDELAAARAGARVSRFARGRIYWSSATGAHAVRGAILGRYLAIGGEAGVLGLPTTDELAAARPGMRVSRFERGRIYWSSATGAHAVRGAVLGRYLALGGESGVLGLPTGEEVAISTGARQWFQGEYLLWDRALRRTFLRMPYFAHARQITARDVPHTWRAGCPVPPSSLRMMRIVHRAWNGDDRVGVLVVHASVVDDMQRVFGRVLRAGFPIRQMVPVDRWGGDDLKAMAADNTSAFNCRHVTGNPYRLSQHSYGNAIDINTVENPYVTASRVYPAGSATYLDRSWVRKGMIVSRGPIALGMAAEGWLWGARWAHPDYQHFSSNGG